MSLKIPPRPSSWRSSLLLAGGATFGMMACNQYEMFRLAGFDQVGFSNKVDILFVIDNSGSMYDEAADLVANFDVFIDTLTTSEETEPDTENLTDAVDNYLAWTKDRGRIMDYRIAITTASVNPSRGWTTGVDWGEAGTLVGDIPVLAKGDDDLVNTFRETLACWTTCWDKDINVPSDGSYTGTPGNCYLPDQGVTQEYLDCMCLDVGYPDNKTWTTNNLCYYGGEKHMESAALALCRAVEDPPDECWDHLPSVQDIDEAIGSNIGFLRPDTPTFVVIVTDEGDGSDRFATGDYDAQPYVDLFEELGLDVKVVAIGPPYVCEEYITEQGNTSESCSFDCNSGGARPNDTKRLISATELTGGVYYYISEPAGPCDNGLDDDGDGDVDVEDSDCSDTDTYAGDSECLSADFEQKLKELGKLLINLQTAFELQTIPDESTIQVYVDEQQIAEAEIPEGGGSYDAGWTYDPSQNAVVFWGKDIPEYNADVRIYYRPLEGTPRDFPL